MIPLFLTCSSGLEPLLERELHALGYQDFRKGFRGVYLNVPHSSDIYRLNYASRLASRVLKPLFTFRCRDQDELYHSIKDFDWKPYFKGSKTLAIQASVDHPSIRNSLYAAQLVKDAICDQLMERQGHRPSVDLKNPDVQFNLFLRSGKGTLSFDTSGEPLHKRGYRQEGGEAPLRETLAAALLSMAEYNAKEVMIDPCAGSGTFLIEAAMMASKTPPGTYRKKWGFFKLPEFNEQQWLKVKTELDSARTNLEKKRFFGIELNRNLQRACLGNIRAAGFHPFIQVDQGNFNDITPAIPPTFLIANPPYGQRLDDEESLIPLYRSLGDFIKRKLSKPARAFILTSSLKLSKEIGLAAKKKELIDHGGTEARFLTFDVY